MRFGRIGTACDRWNLFIHRHRRATGSFGYEHQCGDCARANKADEITQTSVCRKQYIVAFRFIAFPLPFHHSQHLADARRRLPLFYLRRSIIHFARRCFISFNYKLMNAGRALRPGCSGMYFARELCHNLCKTAAAAAQNGRESIEISFRMPAAPANTFQLNLPLAERVACRPGASTNLMEPKIRHPDAPRTQKPLQLVRLWPQHTKI